MAPSSWNSPLDLVDSDFDEKTARFSVGEQRLTSRSGVFRQVSLLRPAVLAELMEQFSITRGSGGEHVFLEEVGALGVSIERLPSVLVGQLIVSLCKRLALEEERVDFFERARKIAEQAQITLASSADVRAI